MRNFLHLCESCRHGEIEIETVYRPLFAGSMRSIESKQLTTYCKFKYCYKHRFIKECSDYKPKSGKIGKGIVQTTL